MLDLAEMHSCNQGIYLESRKRLAYLWLTHFPNGPSVKFLLHNMHTSKELKFTGNCLKGTRPMISFDKSFAGVPHLELI